MASALSVFRGQLGLFVQTLCGQPLFRAAHQGQATQIDGPNSRPHATTTSTQCTCGFCSCSVTSCSFRLISITSRISANAGSSAISSLNGRSLQINLPKKDRHYGKAASPIPQV